MAEPRIMFAGGGSEQDSQPLDEVFSGWVGKGRLLYLPAARFTAQGCVLFKPGERIV